MHGRHAEDWTFTLTKPRTNKERAETIEYVHVSALNELQTRVDELKRAVRDAVTLENHERKRAEAAETRIAGLKGALRQIAQRKSQLSSYDEPAVWSAVETIAEIASAELAKG